MFRTHCIYQDLNEYAKTNSRMLSNELLLYSCNTCDKVFKTVSHMRLHCLIHTNLKPFRCHKCQYSSNCRGEFCVCSYCTTPGVGIGGGGGIGISRMLKFFYVMGKALSGELSCPCDRSCYAVIV